MSFDEDEDEEGREEGVVGMSLCRSQGRFGMRRLILGHILSITAVAAAAVGAAVGVGAVVGRCQE